jgi:hypothetical protein
MTSAWLPIYDLRGNARESNPEIHFVLLGTMYDLIDYMLSLGACLLVWIQLTDVSTAWLNDKPKYALNIQAHEVGTHIQVHSNPSRRSLGGVTPWNHPRNRKSDVGRMILLFMATSSLLIDDPTWLPGFSGLSANWDDSSWKCHSWFESKPD